MNMEEKKCCLNFDPALWDEKEITWENKLFVKDRVKSILHIPLNFGSIMKKNCARIKDAEASVEEKDMLVLSDENSLWGADVYLSVSKEVPGVSMTTLSGTFLTKVFEGPYKNIRIWVKEMDVYVKAQEKECKKIYFFYTCCPKCAKKTGKNYVVLFAQVS